MLRARTIVLTSLAMIAFAGNSLLCRLALRQTNIDAASFTMVRLVSGVVVLWLIVGLRGGRRPGAGNWPSALALFVYAAGFSFAYVVLPTATGALLLFGAVQMEPQKVPMAPGNSTPSLIRRATTSPVSMPPAEQP